MGLVLLDLPSVAVLIHTVEEDGALVVLAAGLDKCCPQDGLVATSLGHLASVALHERLLGASWTRFGRSWRRLRSVLEALGRSWRHL